MTRGERRSGWLVFLAVAVGLLGCSTSDLLKVPFLSVTVQVVDDAEQPVPGAIVEVSNGEQFTTGADGTALLRFGGLGVHQITVLAQDRVPSTFTVSMPMDRGKTMTARLGAPVSMSANINLSTNVNVGGAAGFGMAGFGNMMMAQLYPMLFQSLFSAQGYSMEMTPYPEGAWTEWKLHSGDGDGKPMATRKAYLTRNDKGQEWWQVRLDGDNAEDALTLEVLFAPEKASIRRMRQKMGNEPPQEVPVTEGWYSRPMELTPESLEGSIQARGVQVTVPAGTFTADKYQFGGMMGYAGQGVLRIWRVASVPGGVVKAELTEGQENVVWTSELTAHGTGAKTDLASY